MVMLRFGAVAVSAMALTALPAGTACGAEATPTAEPAPAFQPAPHLQSQFRFRAAPAWPGTASGPRVDTLSGPHPEGAALPASGGDANPYGLASGAGSLNINAKSYASRPGWAFSGRVGPVRWLTPIDGEGDTMLRFGGRVPGQPRLPGMGLFNVGVHYAFE
jgi:hypothetical protein